MFITILDQIKNAAREQYAADYPTRQFRTLNQRRAAWLLAEWYEQEIRAAYHRYCR